MKIMRMNIPQEKIHIIEMMKEIKKTIIKIIIKKNIIISIEIIKIM